ncbi:MAG: hypothetical protein FMNOHCHN_03801 [Ignavibacteriaceae bacterium]|nr:hypothetical protein [Ignavibacteriaceae bacterium]
MISLLSGNRFHFFCQRNWALDFLYVGATMDSHNIIFTLELLGFGLGLEYVWKETKDTKKFSQYFCINL